MTYTRRPIRAHNSWLTRPYPNRGAIIAGVMLHSTRSGVADGDDGPRTEGWWSNPRNIVQDTPPWGSYADILLYEDGTQVICTDWDREHAAWTAGYGSGGTWAAGHHYIQIEIAQGGILDPFTAAQLDSLAQLTAELAKRYQFPVERIPFLAQTGVPPRGICTHEDSANGRKTGKTDPGPMFPWADFLSSAGAYMEDDMGMTPAEAARLEHLEQVVGLITQAPEKFLAPDGAPWNYLLRDKWLSMAIDKHAADEGAHS